MRTFEKCSPVVTAVYFFTVAGIAMFCMNPVILVLSLTGALAYYFIRNGRRNVKSHLYSFALFTVTALINPLVSHNGMTVLFVLNHNPVTLEAVIYGIAAAVMILAVLYLFRSFTEIMTSDKLLYLFGKLSPKLSLVLSMGMRYVPLFMKQAEKINQTQTALGLYKDDNIIDSFKGGLRVFSVMVTWALEKGIVTADSMTARGYGIGKRTHFSHFRFAKSDVLLLAIIIVLSGVTLTCIGRGALDFSYYPIFGGICFSSIAITAYIAYGILTMLPFLIEAEEKIKWKYLLSKI